MQSTLFTPPIVNTYVRESLWLLRFQNIVERFGMFFLHDLDMNLDICVPEIRDWDDADVFRTMGVSQNAKIKFARRHGLSSKLLPHANREEYPIGRDPTYQTLQSALKREPWNIMRKWEWMNDLEEFGMAEDGSIAQIASMLFQKATGHLWLLLNKGWTYGEDVALINPKDLREAMECWSLDKIHRRLPSYQIRPCNAELRGNIVGQRMVPFRERWKAYFYPEKDGIIWRHMRGPRGFVGMFEQEQAKLLTEEAKSELDDALSILFQHVHCLPLGGRTGAIWDIREGSVILLGNPRFYKIDRIGGGTVTSRRNWTHSNKGDIERGLLELEGRGEADIRRILRMSRALKKIRSSRSGKSLNRRQPPVSKVVREEDEQQVVDRDERQVHVEKIVGADGQAEEDAEDEWPAWDEPGSSDEDDEEGYEEEY
jgi:hypothetical protein